MINLIVSALHFEFHKHFVFHEIVIEHEYVMNLGSSFYNIRKLFLLNFLTVKNLYENKQELKTHKKKVSSRACTADSQISESLWDGFKIVLKIETMYV